MAFRHIGKALAILRQQRGISQVELADSCGIGRSQVSRYESGKELMKLDTLEKILAELQVAPYDFFLLVASLDTGSAPPARRKPDRIDDRVVAEAIRNVHSAIDELRRVIERAIDPAVRFAKLIDDAAASRGPAADVADS
jgi:transcriptional regulator with XRE-family HTH domain